MVRLGGRAVVATIVSVELAQGIRPVFRRLGKLLMFEFDPPFDGFELSHTDGKAHGCSAPW